MATKLLNDDYFTTLHKRSTGYLRFRMPPKLIFAFGEAEDHIKTYNGDITI